MEGEVTFGVLPSEIAIHVLSFLPLQDILTVCLVNKQWYAYGVSNTIWRNFYHQYWEGLPLAPSFLECLVESPRQSSEGDSLEDEGEEDEGTSEQNLSSSPKTRLASSRALSSSLYDVKDLRTTFKRKHFLEQNWLNGKCTKHSYVAHPDHAINAIKFSSHENGAILFTGADDNTIKVWKPSLGVSKEKAEVKKESGGFSFSGSLAQLSLSLSSSWSPSAARRTDTVRTSKPGSASVTLDPTLVNTLVGHKSLVWCLDYDRHVLVSGGHDSQLIVWKEDGEIGHAFTDVLEGGINSLMLHHNRVFLTGKNSKSMKLMDIEAQQLIREWTDSNLNQGVFVFTASFEDNLAITSDSNYLRFWDLRQSKCQSIKKIPPRLPRFEVLQMKHNTTLLAIGDADGDISFWDYRKFGEEGAERAKLRRYTHGLSPICDLYFDKHKLVSADKKGVVKVWRLADEGETAMCTIPLEVRLWCFQVDDRAMVCGDREGFVHALDFGDIEEQLHTSKPQDSSCTVQ